MSKVFRTSLTLALAIFGAETFHLQAAETAPLKLNLPAHTTKGTPEDLPVGSHIEPVPTTAPALPEVPVGVKNVAAGKPVTSSVAPYTGELSQVTDEQREPVDEDVVEFKKGSHWVQVDLGEPYEIHAVAMWHDHRLLQAYRDVILQISNDPEFEKDVVTIYNNDTDNSSKRGIGTDREYFELEFGRVVPVKGVKARYVRGYTKGSSLTAINCWQEIEVYALPAK